MNKNIWVSSDTHFSHKNISGPKVSRWGGGYRDFENEFEMNKHLVKIINKYVKEDDEYYHLGDWSFGGIEQIWNFRKQINCKNIHLIFGNHDEHIKLNKVLPNVYEDEMTGMFLDGPPDPEAFHLEVKAQELFTTTQDVLETKFGKHRFFISHYPHLSWHHINKGVIMLHGHEHANFNKLNINTSRMDVGVDSAKLILGEYRPFSIEEIIQHNNSKTIKNLKHH